MSCRIHKLVVNKVQNLALEELCKSIKTNHSDSDMDMMLTRSESISRLKFNVFVIILIVYDVIGVVIHDVCTPCVPCSKGGMTLSLVVCPASPLTHC